MPIIDIGFNTAMAVVGGILEAPGVGMVAFEAAEVLEVLEVEAGVGLEMEGTAGALNGLDDLAQFRAELGMAPGEGTLARLDIADRTFYGISAHGQPVTLRVNAISASHAEADVFQQAANASIKGDSAILYVDRSLCRSCGLNGGVRGMAKQLGLNEIIITTPKGIEVIVP